MARVDIALGAEQREIDHQEVAGGHRHHAADQNSRHAGPSQQLGQRHRGRGATLCLLRRRSDREIFGRFPLHVVPTYPGDETLMSGPLFRLLRPAIASTERKLGDIIRT